MLYSLVFKSGKELKFIFKCNGDDEKRMKEWDCYRESIWYSDFMPEARKRTLEATNTEISIP